MTLFVIKHAELLQYYFETRLFVTYWIYSALKTSVSVRKTNDCLLFPLIRYDVLIYVQWLFTAIIEYFTHTKQKVEIPSMPVDSDGKLIKEAQICRF